MGNGEQLKEKQYGSANRFSARILIHSKYATSKTPWPIWLFSQYRFPDKARILEFGCGNGLIWKVNSFRCKSEWTIVVSDFSQGMIDAAKAYIGENPSKIEYRIIDLSTYKAETGGDAGSYSAIIANHMLYHIENREMAIKTIYELLEKGGEFYASTVGKDNMREMKSLVEEFTGNDNYAQAIGSITDNFSMENGAGQIETAFKRARFVEYKDSLEITEAGDLVNYILSCNDLKPGLTVMPEEQAGDFARFVENKIEKDGKIHISKSSGTFIAIKE